MSQVLWDKQLHLLQRHVSEVDQLDQRPDLPVCQQRGDVHFAEFVLDAIDATALHVAHSTCEERQTKRCTTKERASVP